MTRGAALLAACLLLPGCGAQAPVAADAGGDALPAVADASAADDAETAAPALTNEAPPGAPVVLDALDRIGDAVVGEAFDEQDWLQEWTDEGRHPDVDCRHVGGGVLPAGMSMMVMDGRIARFELVHRDAPDIPRVQAPFGLFTGMARGDVLALLPDGVQTSRHEYGDPGDVYLDWRQPGAPLGLRVEIVGDVASAIFWGDAGATTLIEGCS
ncbi:hypothetical protein [Xanthomonas sp. XNM01]|uniref:hypothetical protein n=1 Tax=Xanthomonas sp. XNM01 TaxID=2769289 RepID=UPI00177A949B|nr:hypothetical protein [Xanthomonas sp. XNM01]MBD9368791.1 hypothetical protein [Xanthomonas sp. XNM01]